MQVNDSIFTAEYAVIEFTTSELLQLSRNEQEFVLSASLILNDVRFHWAIIGRTKEDSEDQTLKTMQMVRALWALRKLASVIVEANTILGQYIGKITQLRELVDGGARVLAVNSASKNYLVVAENLRNRTAFHYGPKELVDHLANFKNETIHRIYPHKQHGNSISAVCEQILTGPTILNAFEGASLNGFQDWCLKNSNSIVTFCNTALGEIIARHFPDKSYSTVDIEMGEEASDISHRWPLFMIT